MVEGDPIHKLSSDLPRIPCGLRVSTLPRLNKHKSDVKSLSMIRLGCNSMVEHLPRTALDLAPQKIKADSLRKYWLGFG